MENLISILQGCQSLMGSALPRFPDLGPVLVFIVQWVPLYTLVLFLFQGVIVCKGVRIDVFASELVSFTFLLCLSPFFMPLSVTTQCFLVSSHWGKSGFAHARQQPCQQNTSAFCGEMLWAAPPMGMNSLGSTSLETFFGAGPGIVGLLTYVGPNASRGGNHASWRLPRARWGSGGSFLTLLSWAIFLPFWNCVSLALKGPK